ncbi:MAG: 3'-5' exonuclease [Candidatus Omnitrophica bacterium]|nr:3'-5' exonuclease [Candidatus Omnitrophota bacterium]
MDEIDLDTLALVFLDVETTGLEPQKGDAVCEIGAAKFKGDKLIGKFHTLINPGRSIPPNTSSIHNIYDEDVKDAPCFNVIADKLLLFLENSILLGYNVGFDLEFLNSELKKINYPGIEMPVLDILAMSRRTFSDLPRYNLKSIARHLEIETQDLHRALNDSLACREIFLKIQDILKNEGITAMKELLTLYGFNNQFLKKLQESKIAQLRKGIKDNSALKISYLFYNNKRHIFVFKPQTFIDHEDPFLLGINLKTQALTKLSLNRILNIEVVNRKKMGEK